MAGLARPLSTLTLTHTRQLGNDQREIGQLLISRLWAGWLGACCSVPGTGRLPACMQCGVVAGGVPSVSVLVVVGLPGVPYTAATPSHPQHWY